MKVQKPIPVSNLNPKFIEIMNDIEEKSEGSVQLLNWLGDDLTVVNVARVSYGKEVEKFTNKDKKLINYLAKHNHWSPFSHPQLQFRLTIPIYVERQFVKSEAGRVYNSISGRYVDFSDTYTIIKEWRKQSKSSKQGSEGVLDEDSQTVASSIEDSILRSCQKAYRDLLKLGISKEQARTILPLNLNTTMIWTGSLYTFIRICKQRIKQDAQAETREVLEEMLQQVKNIPGNPFQHSLAAFGY